MADEKKPTKGEPTFRAGETGGGDLSGRFGGKRSHHGNKPGGTLGGDAPNYDPTFTDPAIGSPQGARGNRAESKDVARGIAERTVAKKRRKE
jgi:hypothetical protein